MHGTILNTKKHVSSFSCIKKILGSVACNALNKTYYIIVCYLNYFLQILFVHNFYIVGNCILMKYLGSNSHHVFGPFFYERISFRRHCDNINLCTKFYEIRSSHRNTIQIKVQRNLH